MDVEEKADHIKFDSNDNTNHNIGSDPRAVTCRYDMAKLRKVSFCVVTGRPCA